MKFLMIALMTLTSANAFANLQSSGGVNITYSDEYGSAITSTKYESYKIALVAGQRDAVQVLNGGQVTDLFRAARDAAESITGEHVENDQDAAITVIDLAEALKE